MKIISVSDNPIHEIPYITAASGGAGMIETKLPVLSAEVDVLPSGLEAIIITSDLQGLDPKNLRLMGHLVAEELEILAEQQKIPPRQKTGVILAGDLYAQMNKRGGIGDVREVWRAFKRSFRWVVGVAGNHDNFGSSPEDFLEFKKSQSIYFLDGNIIKIGELSFAGLSGIMGNNSKPLRRPQKDFLKAIKDLVKESPDILVLHQGPNDPDAKLLGESSIRNELITASNSCNSCNLLVICGHCYWKIPISKISDNIQVVNVDSRVVILKEVRS